MPSTERFSDPATHPLTADLLKRLEALEAEVGDLQKRVQAAGGETGEIKPRVDIDLQKYKKRYGARVSATEGDFSSLPAMVLERPVLIHHPKHLGMKLYAYSNVRRGQPLHIVLHGAMITGTWFPRFERVRSMNAAGHSFCSIADPTIQLDHGLKLAWYVGHDGADPNDWLRELVQSLVAMAEPSQLVFVGSSGGGFAALRLSRDFPDSLAFVTDPQTVVTSYFEEPVRRLLRVGFDGISPDDALELHGDRFSVAQGYREEGLRNFVYYNQHERDEHHIENHLRPFTEALGLNFSGDDLDTDRFRLRIIEGGRRHGPLPQSQFDKQLALAKEWHLEQLAGSAR